MRSTSTISIISNTDITSRVLFIFYLRLYAPTAATLGDSMNPLGVT